MSALVPPWDVGVPSRCYSIGWFLGEGVPGGALQCDALPMGIDYEKYAAIPSDSSSLSPEVQAIEESSERVAPPAPAPGIRRPRKNFS